MWLSKTKERITIVEVRLDELKDVALQQNENMLQMVKASLDLIERRLVDKSEIQRDLDKLKIQLDLSVRAQCATYSAALERVQAMLEYESQKKLKEESPSTINLR